MSNSYCAHVDYFTVTFRAPNIFPMGELRDAILAFFRDEQGVIFDETELPTKRFNYKRAFNLSRRALGDNSVNAGLLAFSELDDRSSNQGLMLSLSGVGCQGIDFAYFLRLFAPCQPRITRVDFPVDYLKGEISLDEVLKWYQLGAFAGSRGFNPTIDKISRTGINGEKKGGFTYGIGRRGGVRYVRVYEKAYELSSIDVSNPFPKWIRFEFELRSNGDATLPIDCCEDVDSFLASAYPRLVPDFLPLPEHSQSGFYQSQHMPLVYESPDFLVSLSHLTHYAQVSYGALVNVLRNHLNQSDEDIVNQLIKVDEVPRRLQLPVGKSLK